MEEYGWVLDYLPHGKAGEVLRIPLVQLVGEDNYTLLEATLKPNQIVEIGERVFIGKGERDKINKIKAKLFYDQLTSTSKTNLPIVLAKIIKSKEKKYIDIFNKLGPINIRVHKIELLPGIGKKHLKIILEEREKAPFESFEDVKKRIPGLPDLANIFANRIANEIAGKEKYYLFTKPAVRSP